MTCNATGGVDCLDTLWMLVCGRKVILVIRTTTVIYGTWCTVYTSNRTKSHVVVDRSFPGNHWPFLRAIMAIPYLEAPWQSFITYIVHKLFGATFIKIII